MTTTNSKGTVAAFEASLTYAQAQDQQDELRGFRERFHLPVQANGKPYVYLCGNSLGLQPKTTATHVEQELKDWAALGVEGHLHAHNPWLPYHEFLTEHMATVVGAKTQEVVVMNTLSVNLHLMMVSFYRPEGRRTKILIEADAFPSDRYAVASQLRFHGYDPAEHLLELRAREGEACIRMEDIAEILEKEGESIALVMLGNTNYYTGQFFDMPTITRLAHTQGCMVGFDCAHGAGNVPLNLHESGADFAVWCTYKYLNSGPGSMAGCFVHERHLNNRTIPRFEGWWGHNKTTRFGMRDDFDPIPTVEAWQLSNPPILSLAAIKASLEIFAEAGMDRLRAKALRLTGYLEFLLEQIPGNKINIITPSDPAERGCQLSIQVRDADKRLFEAVTGAGVIADWREPDVIRVAPVPLYNSFEDVYQFTQILEEQIAAIS